MPYTRMLTTLKIARRLLMTLAGTAILTGSVRPYLLDQIKDSGTLNVVTRNSPTAYFEDRSGPAGYEYDLIRAFAEYLGVELNLIVVNNLHDAMDVLLDGDTHIAAAGFTREQTDDYDVMYGPAYSTVSEQVIYRRRNHQPVSLADLQGGRLMVTAGSRHASTLRRWQRQELPTLTWRETTELDASDLLQMVSDQELDYTLVNSSEFRLVQSYLPNLDVAFTLGEVQTVAWVMPRLADASLREKIYDFFLRPETGMLMETLSERYYGHVGQFDYVGAHRFLRNSIRVLPLYRPAFEKAAEKYGFDWRLLAAMGYQESHWNPTARSYTGVRGIMMLTQRTASDLGIEDRLDPAQSIRGGSRYLSQLRDRLDESITEPDRTWMAMAAYNVGLGHLEDARALAQDMGYNPNLWNDIKEVLPLLSQKRYYSKTRYGYARGSEPVTYVQNIRRYYDVLIWKDETQLTSEQEQNAENSGVTVIPPLTDDTSVTPLSDDSGIVPFTEGTISPQPEAL